MDLEETQSYEKALAWLQKTPAQQKEYFAQLNKSIRANLDKYREAAQKGNAKVQYRLGYCLSENGPIPRDPQEKEKWVKERQEGIMWLQKAEDQGDQTAKTIRKLCAQSLAKSNKWLHNSNLLGDVKYKTKRLLENTADRHFDKKSRLVKFPKFFHPTSYQDKNAFLKWLEEGEHPFLEEFARIVGFRLENREYICLTDFKTYIVTNRRVFFLFPEKNEYRHFGLDTIKQYRAEKPLFQKTEVMVFSFFDNSTVKIPTAHAISSELFEKEIYSIEEGAKKRKARSVKFLKEQKEKKGKEEAEKQKRQEEKLKRDLLYRQKREREEAEAQVRQKKEAREKFPPPDYCKSCGESVWSLLETSPNMRSGIWSCDHCGKSVRILSSELRPESSSKRDAIPKQVQREVWRRDGGRCVECESLENLEFDHIIPVSKGGSNTARNIQLLCQECNRRKGASDPGEF